MQLEPGPAERLIQVAETVLAEEGLEALSLRQVARRAGLSHGAPLRHFPSLSALRSEVAARGFQQLEEAIAKAGAQLPPGSDPLARLALAGRAYVEMAVANPDLFALMFRPELLDQERPAFVQHSIAAFDQLVQGVRAAQDAGFHPGRDTRILAGAVWAAVHGLATLWAQGAFAVPTGASLEQALSTTLSLMVPIEGEIR